MLCDECKMQPACVHITKVVNDQKQEWNLCESCAKKSGEIGLALTVQNMLENNLSVHDFVKALFEQVHIANPAEPERQEPVCSICGMNYVEFRRTGKLGCDQCYQTFAGELEPLVKKIHGACVHTGKIPRRAGAALSVWQRIRSLRQELEQLVAREAYEQAAVVRDEIRELEKKLQNSQADASAQQQTADDGLKGGVVDELGNNV